MSGELQPDREPRNSSLRSGRFLFLLVTLVVLAVFYVWYWQIDRDSYSGSNAIFLLVVNLNILLLCLLAFLIGRNIVRLVFDRRRRILGSALRLRLVSAFLGLALVPTVVLFLLASGLLQSAVEGWFSSQIESSVNGAVDVARFHYNSMKSQLQHTGQIFERQLRHKLLDPLDSPANIRVFEAFREESGLFSIKLLDSGAKVLLVAENAAASLEPFEEPHLDNAAMAKALRREVSVLSSEKQGAQYLTAYLPLQVGGRTLVLLLVQRLDPELIHSLAAVNDSFKEYQQLKLVKGDIQLSYFLMLAMITGSLLFAATWLGFYIARNITVPIQKLAEGTRALAAGDYNFSIDAQGDDEIGILVAAFNQMTSDLRQSREVAGRRKLYLESILSNLAVGVIGLDPQRRLTSINRAASGLLGADEDCLGKMLAELLDPEAYAQIDELLKLVDEVQAGSSSVHEKQISHRAKGRESKIVCTAGRVLGPDGSRLGTLLLLDDITELSKAQNMAVWREVARRIAHEIKNPLTPIQLAAQRLQKLLVGSADSAPVNDSVQAIVENVDSIKRLANEFSNFARMPTAEFEICSLNSILSDTVADYAENHPDVEFQFLADQRMPSVSIDREQIRRVLINLIDNAIDALEKPETTIEELTPRARIIVKSSYERRSKTVSFEVGDNGPGIKAQDKSRIFEPYFTTKSRGTGLGLAIVTSIISDHQGDIRVYDNSPRGTKFIVDLPLAPSDVTQRKLSGVPEAG